jgi:hypothetical protein
MDGRDRGRVEVLLSAAKNDILVSPTTGEGRVKER